MKKGKKDNYVRAVVLVRSCCAGVATGDVRHPPCGQAARPDLDAGSASRCASALRTPSASAPSREDMECCVSPRPVRTISLVPVVFDEPPPGAVGPSIAYEGGKVCGCGTSNHPCPLPWNPREGDDVPARNEFRTSVVGASWRGPFTLGNNHTRKQKNAQQKDIFQDEKQTTRDHQVQRG